MNIGTVQGGTNAGWRKVKPAPVDWKCPSCQEPIKSWWSECPYGCGTLRP